MRISTAVARALDALAARLASRLEPARAETVALRQEMLALRRQAFYAAAAELVRRHAGECALPAGPDLTRFELRACSQNGEDGVIAEILRRAGAGACEFIEFGAGAGLEGSCVALADLLGWRGLFMEADAEQAQALAGKYRGNEGVRTRQARVTVENVDELLAAGGASEQPDVLSIDIDGNDIWVWRAITRVQPRVVVIEYNAGLDHDRPLAVPYDPDREWGGTDWFGASLAALEVVGGEKGYRLVHTDVTGVNAFFVRDDLAHLFGDIERVPRRSPNYFGYGSGHPKHPADSARYVEVG